jgi:hypothetical protein
MPTNRRKRLPRRRANVAELSFGQRYHLERGFLMLSSFGDLSEFKFAWRLHRATILPEFIAANPGRRPFGWWLLDHGRERPVTASWASPAEVEGFRHGGRVERKFGFLHTSILGGDGLGEPLQEPEDEYLARLGLLGAAELQALRRRGSE